MCLGLSFFTCKMGKTKSTPLALGGQNGVANDNALCERWGVIQTWATQSRSMDWAKAQPSAEEISTFPWRRRKQRVAKVIFLVVYLSAPTDKGLGTHRHPSGTATQTLVKSDPGGWSSLPCSQYSSFPLPASTGPMTTLFLHFILILEPTLFFYQDSQFIGRNARGPHVGSWVSTLVMAGGNPSIHGAFLSYPQSQSTNASERGHLLWFTPKLFTTDDELTCDAFSWKQNGSKAADRQTAWPCVLLGDAKISRVGWGREYGKELVKILKTNSWFLPFLPWAHPHTDAMLVLTAKEWEWRKGLGLVGWREGRLTCVGEMVGPAEDRKRTGTRWGGETGRRKMTNRVQMLT